MRLCDCLQDIRLLLKHSTTPALDTELLIMHILNKPRAFLYANSDYIFSRQEIDTLYRLVNRRCKGEPIAYILEKQAFWTIELSVNPDVLIPRPETEHLIEWILENLNQHDYLDVADLGTGSGAIAITLAHEKPSWQVTATDISVEALLNAQQNAKNYQLSNIDFYLNENENWCSVLPQKQYDLIISNPPYLAPNDPHLKALQHEPISALVAKEDGFSDIEAIISEAIHYLKPGGYLVIEHGFDQQDAVLSMMKKAGLIAMGFLDLNQLPRFVAAQKRQKT